MLGLGKNTVPDSLILRLEALESAPTPPPPPDPTAAILIEMRAHVEDRLAPLSAAFTDLEKRLRDTNVAVAEGIERTDRSERRIASTVARARKELRESDLEHPGLEAEAHELRKVDGDRSDGGRVQPVPEAMEGNPDEPSSIRGVPASTLRRVRGIG